MPRRNKADFQPAVPSWQDNPPAGATREAFDREENGGNPIDEQGAQETDSDVADKIRDGAQLEEEAHDEDVRAYAGPAGGAVGGTPANMRSVGGKVHGGLAPGGSHRGDSTIGANPDEE